MTTDAYQSPEEQITEALNANTYVSLDESDTAYVALALTPLLRQYAAAEYERGVEYGRFIARQAVANRLGLGDLVPPPSRPS